MAAPATTKEFCSLLVRSKLMSADEVTDAVQKFQAAGKDAEDLDGFRKHLFATRSLTEYQLALLSRGHSEGFFLDHYKILELIAKGHLAGVYKAAHRSGQVVAIKVLPSSKAKDPEALGRFRREARLITKLDHPNIVRAFQLGETGGRNYVVMEHLEGDTLDDVLAARKKLTPAEAMRIAHQVMLALQHLHERGMIHRNIDPANIMLLDAENGKKDGDTLTRAVKILDIGLGKSLFDDNANASEEDPSKLTTDGMLLGSPEYLAPEQARKASGVDIRSDIYSVGCVLFHMLTGQPPFKDKSILNQIMRHATEPPRPLSDLISPVPDGLQNVLNMLLAKDVAQRFQSPDKAAQALQLLIRNLPNAQAPAPNAEYLKWLREGGSAEAAALPPSAAAPAAQAVPAAVAVGKLESPGRKQDAGRKAPSAAAAAPVAVANFDVELVDVSPPMIQRDDDEPRGLFELDRRDAIMLGFGAGFALSAILGGYGLSRAMRRAPVELPPEPEPETKE